MAATLQILFGVVTLTLLLLALVLRLRDRWPGSGAGALARVPLGPITLGGRAFRRVPVLSVAQDEHFLDLVASVGVRDPDLQPGEDLKAYGERIFAALHQAHVIRPMVACMITPVGVDAWTPEIARETEEFLGALDGEADKRRYYALVAELLPPFYRSGLASWPRSSASGAPSPVSGSPGPAISPAHAPATGGA